MSYLEEYLEKISYLPIDINRNLRLIKELDTKAQTLTARLEELQNNYISQMKTSKDKKQESQKPENQEKLEEIKRLQTECLALSKEKFNTARQNYELLDSFVEKLDDDLKKFEEDIRGQGDEFKGPQDDMSIKESGGGKRRKFEPKYSKKNKPLPNSLKPSLILRLGNEILEAANTPIDPNEPKYCYCNGFSHGDMISCDNPFCEKEWFHFQCIGITTKPKGRWYCKECKALKQKDLLKF